MITAALISFAALALAWALAPADPPPARRDPTPSIEPELLSGAA
jgi:hypothetical protein